MARSLRYHPLFDSDVLNAAVWYDERQLQLGSDLVDRVQRAVSQMTADPDRRKSSDYGVRYWPVERFPFVVFYDLTEETPEHIRVARIVHGTRNLPAELSRDPGGLDEQK